MYTSDAVIFAIEAHDDQKYGKLPYAMHLAEVASILVREFGVDSSVMINAAWLHDVIEDTDVTYERLVSNFGYLVANIVELVSDPDLPTRKEREAEFIRRMSGISILHKDGDKIKALIVKLADRIANLRAGLREGNPKLDMYLKEHEAFSSLFTTAFLESDVARRAVDLYYAEIEKAKYFRNWDEWNA